MGAGVGAPFLACSSFGGSDDVRSTDDGGDSSSTDGEAPSDAGDAEATDGSAPVDAGRTIHCGSSKCKIDQGEVCCNVVVGTLPDTQDQFACAMTICDGLSPADAAASLFERETFHCYLPSDCNSGGAEPEICCFQRKGNNCASEYFSSSTCATPANCAPCASGGPFSDHGCGTGYACPDGGNCAVQNRYQCSVCQ